MGRVSSAMRTHVLVTALAVGLTLLSTVAVEQEHVQQLSAEAEAPPVSLLAVAEGAAAGKISINLKEKKGGRLPKGKSAYTWIPNFVMKHMGEEENVKGGVAACERVCNKHKTCLSYSFRAKDGLCIWSIEAMQYKYDWTFYTKVHEINALGKWTHYGKYRRFPGLLYQEPGYQKFKNKSIKQCKKICTKVKKCKAFSYHERGRRCMLSDAGMHYDPEFQYYEKKSAAHRKTTLDVEDEQEILQKQENAAKKGKRDRILESMRERNHKSTLTAREMRNKKVTREVFLKKKLKKGAEKRLRDEKAREAHDKRMARMKAAYNEGYFKAKGVIAEKKTKEKNIKALRKKERHDKEERVNKKKARKQKKINKEKAKKKKERDTKKDLLLTKEKLVKLKNKEIKDEISKEEHVLDVARNLALAKVEIHEDVVEKDKKKRRQAAEKSNKKVKEMKVKTAEADKAKKREMKKLEKQKDKPLTLPKKPKAPAPNGKAKGKAKGKRKGKAKGKKRL